jgi:hypothetical protein
MFGRCLMGRRSSWSRSPGMGVGDLEFTSDLQLAFKYLVGERGIDLQDLFHDR